MDSSVAEPFLEAMESADSLLSLPESEFAAVVETLPPEARNRGNDLLHRLEQHHQEKQSRLASILSRMDKGDAARGRQLFMSEKAKCSACHRVGDEGHRVGPELTTIGGNRSAADLLESLIFPSASIVRDYELCKILTVDGRVLNGIVINDSAATLSLQKSNGEVVQLHRSDIESIRPSAVSMMPSGLDELISDSELVDIVKYLQTLQPPSASG